MKTLQEDIINKKTVYQLYNPNIYQHYKGGIYKVLDLGKHTETGEELVIYHSLDHLKMDQVWVRPLTMFLEQVEHEGQIVPRFTQMNNSQ